MSGVLVCSCCDKQKNELKPKMSKLMKGQRLFICEMCDRGKKEPRWLVVLYARQNGAESVSSWIKYKRYEGAEILAKELTT